MRDGAFDDLFATGDESGNARMAALERLYMRLLYSDALRQEYERDPARVLERAGLEGSDARHLPSTSRPPHRREMHGRRMLAATQVWGVFKDAFATLDMRSPRELAQAAWFATFLDSDEFFHARHSLPCTFAIGRGYEGNSRFFFWARARTSLISREPSFVEALFAAFGVWLVLDARRGQEPALARFRRGVFWMNAPPAPGATIVTGAGRSVTMAQADHDALVGAGLVDLRELSP